MRELVVLCHCTGKSYLVTNQKSLVQCMESLTQKVQPGVVINFQKIKGITPSLIGEQEMIDTDGKDGQGPNSNMFSDSLHRGKLAKWKF